MPEQTKESGIQLDIEKNLLDDAIFETQGRLYTDDEIELLALDQELSDFQQLQIEIHDELFNCGMGWDDRSNWADIHHADVDNDTKETLGLKREVQLFAASCFVQHKRKYLDVQTNVELTDLEIFRALSQKIAQKFHKWYQSKKLTASMIDEISFAVVNGTTIDPRMSFALYSGKKYMLPGNKAKRLWRNGYCDLNDWVEPTYRHEEAAERDEAKPLGSLQDLIDFAIKTPLERQILLDWLGWSLRYEYLKPRWAIFLFSETKGTGKSTLLELGQALFGEANTANENGIEGLTQRFASDSLSKKFVKVEEVKLSSHSDAGNKMKDYITGDAALVDVKHMPKQTIPLKCAFMLTTNHKPTWLEGGERRYFLIDMDHAGHAYGDRKDAFDEITAAFRKDLENPKQLKRWYIELTGRNHHKDFDPFVLKPQKIGSPLMKELMGEARIEVKDVLEDLLAIYSVTVIPSADQQLLVNHLKLKGQQSLRNILRDLGWLPISARFDGKTQRIWVRQDNTVEKGRLDAPILSQDLEGAIPLGFTWWPISQAISKGWHELTAHVLRPVGISTQKQRKAKQRFSMNCIVTLKKTMRGVRLQTAPQTLTLNRTIGSSHKSKWTMLTISPSRTSTFEQARDDPRGVPEGFCCLSGVRQSLGGSRNQAQQSMAKGIP